jgi:hypothetical protein
MQGSYPHLDSVRRFVDCLAPKQPLLVALFGSVATGDFTSSSDADVLAVFVDPPEWPEVYACSDGWVQPLVASLSDFKARLIEGDGFTHEILEDGLLLDGPPELWGELKELAQQTRERLGIKRQEYGWSYRPHSAPAPRRNG